MPITKLNPREEIMRKNLRGLRKFTGLSRTDFSIETQVPATTIKNYENGYRAVSVHCLQNIGIAYGWPIAKRMLEPTVITSEEFGKLMPPTLITKE